MARKAHEDALGVAGAETVIGTGVVVHGNLDSESDIAIDGILEGSIKTAGNVMIGVNADIKANIEASSVAIAGSVKGNVTTEGETSILETGHLVGDVKAAGLAISSGGIFVGRSMINTPPRLAHHDNNEPQSEAVDATDSRGKTHTGREG